MAVSEVLGGGELFTLRLAEALKSKCDVGVAGSPGTPVIERARERGIRVEHLSIGRKLGRKTAVSNLVRLPLSAQRLNDFIDGHRPCDWIILQYSWEKLLWRARSAGGRVAVLEHGPIPPALLRLWPAHRSMRATLQRCDALFAVSQPAASDSDALALRSPFRLQAGVDLTSASRAMARRSHTRKQLGIPSRSPILAFAGRLAAEKGLFELLSLATRLTDVHLLLMGSGPAESTLKARAEKLALNDRAHFLGFVDNPLPQLAAADLTCMLRTGPGEGRPLLALESLSVGTPVLGDRQSAAMAALAAEYTGGVHLVDPGDLGELDSAVKETANRPRPTVAIDGWDKTAICFAEELERSHRTKGGFAS